jgi:signal transduction histidine kinase
MRRLATWAAGLPPRAQDLALAAVLVLYNVASLIPETRQLKLPYAAFSLVVLEVAPLTWRRSRPVLVFVAVGIPRILYDQLGIGFAPVPLGPAIAYYTVMDRCPGRARLAISLLVAGGIIRSQMLPGQTEPYGFFAVVLQFTVAGTLGILARTRRAYLEAVEGRAEQAEGERDRQVALAAAQERTRIARELHDVVAHHVSLMAVQSEAAAALLPAQPVEAGKSVEIIGQTAREALAELRRLLGVLRGPADLDGRAAMSPSPSVSDLDEVLEPVRQAGIMVDLRIEGSPGSLPPGVDLTAYRIVQEALTNTIRHSGASQATVIIRYEPGYVTVSVSDTGNEAAAGTDRRRATRARAGPPRSPGSGTTPMAPAGFGLAGIAERVTSCGGRLTVGPGDNGGFTVTARLPTR